jgi:long-chain fatty acid transport protein
MTQFDKYKGLFAEQGDFDIPENYAIGLAVKLTPKLTVAADVMKIMYSDIASVGNRHPTTSILDPCTRPLGLDPSACDPARTLPPEQTSSALGANNGWGFGWEDSTAYKLGLAYDVDKRWTLRAGVNYGESVIPDDQLLFNLLAPATVEWHATFGFTYAPSDHQEWNFNFMHAFENAQTCDAPSCTTMFTQGEGQYVGAKMSINTAGVSWGYKF